MRLAKTAVGVAGLLACLIVGASVALGYVQPADKPASRAELESGSYEIDVAGRLFRQFAITLAVTIVTWT